MAVNTDSIDYREDYYKGFAKFYFNRILDTIIDFGDLKNEPGLILDYGCGVGHLKQRVGRSNIVGYDIIEELTETKDYKSLKPAKIVLSGVLEHLFLDDIEKLMGDFVQMNPRAEVLVFLPTENVISKIMMFLSGQNNAHDDHVSKYGEINKVIERYYYPEKRKYIFFRMAQITRYIPLCKNL